MAELDIKGIGVATADSELRHVGDKNTAVCSVNLAFNRNYKTKWDDTEWQQETCFLRAQIWGARAERMAELVQKGQPIYVSGYLKQDSWEDKESGKKRISYSITLRDFQLCVKGTKKSEAQTAPETTKDVNVSPVAQVESFVNNDDDSDVPF